MLLRQRSNDSTNPSPISYIRRGKRKRWTNHSGAKIVLLIFIIVVTTHLVVTIHSVYKKRNRVLLTRQTSSNNADSENIARQESKSNPMTRRTSIDTNRSQPSPIDNNISSVDYMACCGLGHRLSKMADAYYLSKQLNFTLRGYWGYCDTFATHGRLTEVFHHLFGPQTIPIYKFDDNQGQHMHMNHYARINNDVPGFQKLMRVGNHCDICNRSASKAKSDYDFYINLRNRFRMLKLVDDFYLQSMSSMNRTVVGIHIRAGNGESGDFHSRGRHIDDMDEWLDNLTNLIVKESRIQRWKETVIFIATDTPSIIVQLRHLIQKKKGINSYDIVVVERDQFRPASGFGVLFGQQGDVERSGEDCLRGWEDTLIDMMLLSQVDILISARPSSFTQSLPMSLLLGRNDVSRRFMNPYCEVDPQATEMQCFVSFIDWCCHGRTSFALTGIQRYEYMRVPGKLFEQHLNVEDPVLHKQLKIQKRPESGCIPLPAGTKQICLPNDWGKFHVKPRPLLLMDSG